MRRGLVFGIIAATCKKEKKRMDRARLFVVSAPSGCGKGPILAKAFENRPVYYSVSYTTREKREGEQEGVNYFYTTRKEFEKWLLGVH